MKNTRVLVALDGSEYSQNASLTAFWIAKKTDAELEAISVVDPRIVDLFLSPEFAEDLGIKPSIDASAKIIQGLKKIATVILKLWKADAEVHMGCAAKTHMVLGDVTEEILKAGKNKALIVVGHRGVGYKNHQAALSFFRVGSVAERVAVGAKKSVLISVSPPDSLKTILVAYDGSEPSKGALLLGEQLAIATGIPLKAVLVVREEDQIKQASSIIEMGASLLRNYQTPEQHKEAGVGNVAVKTRCLMQDVFDVKVGQPANTILREAEEQKALLIVGAYGFKDPEENVVGSTTTHIVRATRTSVLVYR